MGSYSAQQNAFVFSLVSNAASSASSDFAEAITTKFDEVTSNYASFIGTGWSIAWGPVVFSESTDRTPKADNALVVVQGTDASGKPLYIVATAGTNPKSLFDEKTEDLDLTLVPFAGGGNITTGTNIGLMNLLGMTSNNQTLQQFLSSCASSNATLIFTGHSLGGALTPALALSIETSGWGQVYAYPTAGPTPGDAGFVTAFTTKFPTPQATTDPTSTWNCNIVNQIDLVPMAWTDISGIGALYPQLGPPSPCVTDLQNAAAALVPSPDPFVDLPRTTFDRGFVPPQPPLLFAKNPTILFMTEALYQHSTAYTMELVPDLVGAFPGIELTDAGCVEIMALCVEVSAESVASAGAGANALMRSARTR